jgi:hypothetical protein
VACEPEPVDNRLVKGTPVAGRLVTWALILLGAAEIPWVIFLAFTQQPVGQVFHVRTAALGLGSMAAVLCAGSAWAVLRRSSWTPALAVCTATTMGFLATVGKLTPSPLTSGPLSDGMAPLAFVLPSVVAAVFVAWSCLRGPAWAVPQRPVSSTMAAGVKVAAVVLAGTAAIVAGRTVLHVLQWDSTATATHARAIVVVLDALQAIGLLGTGLASLAGRERSTLVLGSIAVSLLVCDAFGNVVLAASGQPSMAAVFYLFVGELPAILLCALAIRAAHRHLADAGGVTPKPVAPSPTPSC